MTQQHELSEQSNTETLPFHMDHLPDFFRTKAEKELNETPENRVESLKEMKGIIKTEKDLKDIEFNEDMLIQFLRHSKYKVTKAITQLQSAVTVRKRYEIYFRPIPTEAITRAISRNLITFLPMRSPGGCPILHVQCGNWDPDQISVDILGQMTVMMFQQALRDPMTQINGFIAIYDMKDVSFKCIRQFTPHYLRLMYYAFVAYLPARYKGAHLLNTPNTFKIIWTILKTLLPEKLKKLVFFHSSPEELFRHFPRSVLPATYGGDLEDYLCMTDWVFKANEQFEKCSVGGQTNYY